MTGALVIPRTAFEIRTALALKTALRPVTLPKKAQQMSGVKTFYKLDCHFLTLQT